MSQHYSDPKRENDPHALPDLETFYVSESDVTHYGDHELLDNGEAITEAGWYWWACFPGCLPDSEPNGPFKTEEEALENARKDMDDDDDEGDDEPA
jgi:hypothetical protein